MGATSPSYAVESSGSYYVEVRNNIGCSAVSEIQSVVITSSNEMASEAIVVVYPNPVSMASSLKVRVLSSYELMTYRIIHPNGQVASNGILTNSNSIIQLPAFAPGLYFLEIVNGEKKLTHYFEIVVIP